MNTTKPAEVNRRVMAATAVAFILLMVWTAGSLIKVGLADRPPAVATTGRHSDDPGGRTREAVAAKGSVAAAQAQGADRKGLAYGGPGVPVPPRLAAADSPEQGSQLQRQLETTQAKPVNSGLVLTPGDVLFTSGRADLKPAAIGNLKKLVNFLAKYQDRSIAIKGYTDSVGNGGDNQELSERRANSVKAYLVAQGIDSTRLSAVGMGQSNPVAANDSRAGRQQNRRAEVIIKDPPAALPQRTRTERMIVLLMLLQSVSGRSGRPFM